MTTAAIICEYNPFHNGHLYHIEETKRRLGADAVVAIMSGNLVQRGDFAIFDKKVRARAAVLGGADLVLELPYAYSTASAEFFARGAVNILNSLGIIDHLSFGLETKNQSLLEQIAHLLAEEPDEYKTLFKEYIVSGLSFPLARAKAVSALLGKEAEDILSSPNNILGIEYIKALTLSNSQIKPFSILRKEVKHDSLSPKNSFASASLLRKNILEGKDYLHFCPDFCREVYGDAAACSINRLDGAILSHLIKMSREELKKIPDVTEGLENRILDAAKSSSSFDEVIEKVKTKRYTHSRIRRIILLAFLGITESERRSDPQYIKVLDHNETGQKLIAAAKKTAVLPILRNTSQVNKLKNPQIKTLWEREQIFDKLHQMTKI